MDWTWLVYLICPLMMLPMMYFMMKGNHRDEPDKHQQGVSEEIARLKKQNEEMQKELEAIRSVSK